MILPHPFWFKHAHTYGEKELSELKQTEYIGDRRHNSSTGWKAHFEALTVHAMQIIPFTSAYLGFLMPILPKHTDERAENTGTLWLPSCLQPLPLFEAQRLSVPPPHHPHMHFLTHYQRQNHTVLPALVNLPLAERKLSAPTKNFRQVEDDAFLCFQRWQPMKKSCTEAFWMRL